MPPVSKVRASTSGVNTDYLSPGARATNGYKGEGIAGTPRSLTGVPGATGTEGYPFGDRARGAPGNAGGGGTDGNPAANDQNAGGGGGGNGGTGGIGGNTWQSNLVRGGYGGVLFPATAARIIMGGGGGAGSRNNCGVAGGADGGGIILLRAQTVGGTGTLSARGDTATNVGNDGAGGGGAGGSIVVVAASGTLANLTALAGGGNGGYSNLQVPPAPAAGGVPGCFASTGHGPGGGGGGGVVLLSSAPAAASNLNGGVNGLTNVNDGDHDATPTPQIYGAAPGGNGTILSTLTRASVPGVETCLASTRASIAGLRVEPSGTIEFVTSVQRGTVGFNVYGLNRRRDTRRTRLNDRLIASPMPDSLAPIFYRLETAPITARFLLIEEIERHGRRRLAGPFAVDDAALRAAFEAVEVRVESTGRPMRERAGARFIAGGTAPRAPRPRGSRFRRDPDRRANLAGVKIEVEGRGTVTVPLADLAAMGLSVDRPRQLRVWNAGRPVAVHIGGSGPSLRFEADAFSSDYTDRNAYVVTALTAPPAPSVSFTRSGPAPMAGAITVERNVLYAPFLPREADPWVWDFLLAGSPAGPYTFELPPAPAAGTPVGVRVIVTGLTEHAHVVEAALNGVAVGRVGFTGQAMAEILGHVPAESLRASGNELMLTYAAETTDPDDVGLAVLDRVEVGVARGPVAGPAAYTLSPYDTTLPAIGDVDYLVVTHELFRAQAEAIAALKAAEGHRPLVVDVARAYDRFSAGLFEARAVKALIHHVAQRSRLRYVLLVGDDTFDYRDLTGLGLVSYVPSLEGWDGEFGRVPSENRFADLDDDGRPEVAIGRLPVQTVEDADVMVDKISRQAAVLAAAQGPHLIAVDNDGPGDALFHAEAETLAARLPSASWADLALGLAPARTALFDGLAAGAPATHYFGHGGHDRWADEGLLTGADVAALSGSTAETVLFTWACEVQWYQYDGGPSLNEALLLTPQGGALAAVGPVGITDPAYQSPFQKRVYAHFLAGVPLGEALRRAKVEIIGRGAAFEPVAEGWNLLGDPALKLPSAVDGGLVSRTPNR